MISKHQTISKIFICILLILTSLCDVNAQRYIKKKQKWKQLGPVEVPEPMGKIGAPSAHGMGLIQSLWVSPKNQKYILAGSNSGGIYKTIDGGENWQHLNNFGLVTGVLDIEVDFENEDEIWIATGTTVNKEVFGHGVLHSIDGGKSWEKTALDFIPQQQEVVWQIARSKTNPNLFFACTAYSIYKSTNRGDTWTKVLEAEKGIDFRELFVHPSNPDYIIASGERLFYSKDGGTNWGHGSDGMQFHKTNMRQTPNRIAVSKLPDRDSSLIALYKAGYKNYIEVSDDWGATWKLLNVNRTFNRVDKANAEIAVPKSAPNTIYVGCVSNYKSTDKGARFKQISVPYIGKNNRVHDDVREMICIDSNTVYVACDGGVSATFDGGQTWKDLSGKGLSVSQFYGISHSPVDKYPVIGGCQDLSSIIIDNNGARSTGHIYGDGGNCLLDSKGNWYIMQNGHPRMSTDSGKTWKRLKVRFYPNSYDYPFQLDPANEDYFYMADHFLFRSNAKGDISNISKDVPKINNKIRELDINLSDPKMIIFAKDEPTWGGGELLKNKLFRSRYTGDSLWWEDITPNIYNLAWRSVSGITSHSDNSNQIWISLYGYDDNIGRWKVFYSEDRGDTWVNYSDALPNYNSYAIEHIPGSKQSLFLAMDDGIYFRNKRSKKWVRMRGDLPEIMVKSIAINTKKRRLRVGTYGNGIWEMKIPRRMLK